MKLILKVAAFILLISGLGFSSCKKEPTRLVESRVERRINPKILIYYYSVLVLDTFRDSIKTFSTPTLPPGYSADSIDRVMLNLSTCGDPDWGCLSAQIEPRKNPNSGYSYYEVQNNKVVVYIKLDPPYWITGGEMQVHFR